MVVITSAIDSRDGVFIGGRHLDQSIHPKDLIMTALQVINGTNSSDDLLAPDDQFQRLEINGQGGDDYIWSNMSDDIVRGGDGNDEILAFDGDDYIEGNQGDDKVYGGDGDDYIEGGEGYDVLYGEGGDDVIIGENGGGWLFGGTGDDFVIGGDGDDIVSGEEGDDYLSGGSGNDHISGGEGMDSFSLSEGTDTIYDFDMSYDTIIIDTEMSGDGFDIALFNTTIDGQDAMTIWHNTGMTTLIGMSEESFSWDSVNFA